MLNSAKARIYSIKFTICAIQKTRKKNSLDCFKEFSNQYKKKCLYTRNSTVLKIKREVNTIHFRTKELRYHGSRLI